MILLIHNADDCIPALLHYVPGLGNQRRLSAKLKFYPVSNRLQVIVGRDLPKTPVWNFIKFCFSPRKVALLKISLIKTHF
jgi:hypothetical protein